MAYHGVLFDPTSFTQVVMNNVSHRLEMVGELLASRAQENFIAVSPPPSDPWQFPHADSWRMHDAIGYKVFDRTDAIVMQAGIVEEDLPNRLEIYPHMLETGTSRMDPRPWLTITLDESWAEMVGIMTGAG